MLFTVFRVGYVVKSKQYNCFDFVRRAHKTFSQQSIGQPSRPRLKTKIHSKYQDYILEASAGSDYNFVCLKVIIIYI